MTRFNVTVDSRACEQMLSRIGDAATSRRELGFAVGRAADRGASMISGIPFGATGRLSGTVRAYGWHIVAPAKNARGVPYGRFVFGGAYGGAQPARPPFVPTGEIARILGNEINQVLYGGGIRGAIRGLFG